jgi:hypothetical protein
MAILHYMIVTTQINNGNCPTLHDSLYRFVMELLILHWGRRGRDHMVVGGYSDNRVMLEPDS